MKIKVNIAKECSIQETLDIFKLLKAAKLALETLAELKLKSCCNCNNKLE